MIEFLMLILVQEYLRCCEQYKLHFDRSLLYTEIQFDNKNGNTRNTCDDSGHVNGVNVEAYILQCSIGQGWPWNSNTRYEHYHLQC